MDGDVRMRPVGRSALDRLVWPWAEPLGVAIESDAPPPPATPPMGGLRGGIGCETGARAGEVAAPVDSEGGNDPVGGGVSGAVVDFVCGVVGVGSMASSGWLLMPATRTCG